MPQDHRHKDLSLDELLGIVRTELKSRGADEIAGIKSKFRRADKNGSGTLDLSEFQQLLTDQLYIHLNEEDQKELFYDFDKNGCGEIQYEEFLHQLRGEMNPQRKKIVSWVFDSIDTNKSGHIDMNDL